MRTVFAVLALSFAATAAHAGGGVAPFANDRSKTPSLHRMALMAGYNVRPDKATVRKVRQLGRIALGVDQPNLQLGRTSRRQVMQVGRSLLLAMTPR